MIKVADGILVKESVIGNVLLQASPIEGAAYTYPQLKSMRRQTVRRGGNIPGLEAPLAYERTLRDLGGRAAATQRERILTGHPDAPKNIRGIISTKPPGVSMEYVPDGGSFYFGYSPKVRTPAANTATTAHELGHYISDLKGTSAGDRGVFGMGGKPATMLASEADASTEAIRAMRRAKMRPQDINAGAAQLANAYGSYLTSARLNPTGKMFSMSVPSHEEGAARLLSSLTGNMRGSVRSPKVLDSGELAKNKLVKHYTDLDPVDLRPDKKPSRYGSSYVARQQIPPVTKAQRMAATQTIGGAERFAEPTGLNLRRGQQVAHVNRRRLLKNLVDLPEELHPTLRSEIKKHLSETGKTFGREAKRGVLSQLQQLKRDAIRLKNTPKAVARTGTGVRGLFSRIARALATKR